MTCKRNDFERVRDRVEMVRMFDELPREHAHMVMCWIRRVLEHANSLDPKPDIAEPAIAMTCHDTREPAKYDAIMKAYNLLADLCADLSDPSDVEAIKKLIGLEPK
jgi:hypothetical protein